jgi:hypothetical protein
LQHQAVERLGVVRQFDLAALDDAVASTAGTITGIAPPLITQCATDCSR